jgi:large subunit ribosomal protein L34e
MAGDSRVTKVGRHSYATKSNIIKKTKTPGGKLTAVVRTKKTAGAKCGDCKMSLAGIPHLKASAYGKQQKRTLTVSRAYGGSRCGQCVKTRIVRAFLIEEQKIVKALLQEKSKAAKK